MKILIDINHPAHVHYFKNFIKIMENNGHSFVVTNRDSDLINYLLDKYNIKHTIRSKRPLKNSFLNSFTYLIKMILAVYKASSNQNIDFFVGFASPACAIVSFLRGKPSVLIDDTEHNKFNHFIYLKFCSVVLTPHFFKKNLGKKQIHFSAYVEQFYLHKNYYKKGEVNLEKPYALIRYISYDARHDSAIENKFSEQKRKELIKKIAKNIFVYVSHENEIFQKNDFYSKFELKIQPENIHDVLAEATIFISEGATMSTEAAILGTETYYINPLHVGNIDDLSKNTEHCFFSNGEDLLNNLNIKSTSTTDKLKRYQEIEDQTIDPTSLLVWFVTYFPQSKNIAKGNIINREFIEKHNIY